jgi:hypothetical protein
MNLPVYLLVKVIVTEVTFSGRRAFFSVPGRGWRLAMNSYSFTFLQRGRGYPSALQNCRFTESVGKNEKNRFFQSEYPHAASMRVSVLEKGPGLKPLFFSSIFRGLKAPAPSDLLPPTCSL